MGERKVLNKYYPPDFDPAKLPKMKLGRDRQYKVRLMAPFHMCCTNCGHYIYKGTKFLAIKENSMDERYLGIQVFRFYIKCPLCSGEITFKTDPQNTDYVCEHGAKRNFGTGWRMVDQLGTMEDELEEEEKEDDAMELLEERTKESKREMDILDSLEDIQDLNAKASKVDVGQLIGKIEDKRQQEKKVLELKRKEDEDKEIREKFYKGRHIKRLEDVPPTASSTLNVSRRKQQVGSDSINEKRTKLAALKGSGKSIGSLGVQSIQSMVSLKSSTQNASSTTNMTTSTTNSLGDIPQSSKDNNKQQKSKPDSSLVGYGSDDSDSSSDED
eukprot:m.138152 g.138152  ORF g.138152 m.138152 type:complete len:328 (+) comp13426_c0_seq1:209-1192(+)